MSIFEIISLCGIFGGVVLLIWYDWYDVSYKKNNFDIEEFQDNWVQEEKMKSFNDRLEKLETRVENTECVLGFFADNLEDVIAKERKKKKKKKG